MIDTGNSKKMVEKEGPASGREAGPFFFNQGVKSRLSLSFLQWMDLSKGFFSLTFFVIMLPSKSIILL